MALFGNQLIWNIGISLILLIITFVSYKILISAINKNAFRNKVTKRTVTLTQKTLRWVFIGACVTLLIVLWGGNLQNFRMTLMSIFGIIAIGFFAVWSILSNIVAGVILLTSKNINIDDNIEIVNENISGKIIDINSMFVILKSGKDKIQIPNNLLLQKSIKITINKEEEF